MKQISNLPDFTAGKRAHIRGSHCNKEIFSSLKKSGDVAFMPFAGRTHQVCIAAAWTYFRGTPLKIHTQKGSCGDVEGIQITVL
jgi:hypothetical protein